MYKLGFIFSQIITQTVGFRDKVSVIKTNSDLRYVLETLHSIKNIENLSYLENFQGTTVKSSITKQKNH